MQKDLRNSLKSQRGITVMMLMVGVVIIALLAGVTFKILFDTEIFDQAEATQRDIQYASNSASQVTNKLRKELRPRNEVVVSSPTDTETPSTNGVWNPNKGANSPKLLSGMTGVYWTAEGVETTVTNDNYSKWYNYANNQWANAKTADGSYWVWIPRFAYKITGGYNKSIAGEVEIKFLQGTTNNDNTGTAVDTTYPDIINGTMQGYVVHPAFLNGSSKYYTNGEWNSAISGFWVSKYEISRSDATITSVGSATTLKSVPSVKSATNVTIGNAYTYSTSYSSASSSHLMKNSEWGAVAYLTQSVFGRNGNIVELNACSDYITGSGPSESGNTSAYSYSATNFTSTYAYNTDLGKLASSTGNLTGIYDLSGGAYEYVTSYLTNGNSSLTNGNSFIATSTVNTLGYSTLSTKNATVYPIISGSSTGVANFEKYAELTSTTYGFGDAVLETSLSGSGTNAWNYSISNYPNASYPFFTRGGSYNDGANAGIFGYGATNGAINNNTTFRIVLIGG